MKRYKSGSQKRKEKDQIKASIAQLSRISQFFTSESLLELPEYEQPLKKDIYCM